MNLVGIAVALVMAFPVYWMASTALKPSGDILSTTPHVLPFPLTLEHFHTAVTRPFFLDYLRNSLVVVLAAVALSILTAAPAALAVARMRWRGRRAYLLLIILAQTAPLEALLIPAFLVLRDAGLLNRLPALVLTYFMVTLPFTIWTLRGFVAAIPVELEEAAMTDGCTRLGAYRRVVFPLLAPGLVATSVFAFITAWNEFMFALVIMQEQDKLTLPVWLATFRTAFGTDWGGTMAASTLFTLPVLVFFLIVQRRLVAGLSAGAVKG
ncbi:carbohydrate ABC transporter permease [Pseudonocardia humida]|uniref:Carbohydrate ABC transporter permease n=1 Tax=Pseudonocardia humida TaxID=2800819 RepID=A0ABT1A6M3_9PSEU|nr:carbohydrate ABC transporter permease [Pseudonocardia humida]MCO1658625.1 carbohydrate ABC transporter permease [Pseudonocardia humida]